MGAEPDKSLKEMMAEVTKETRKNFKSEYQISKNLLAHAIGTFVEVENEFKDREMEPYQLAVYSLAVKNFRLSQKIADAVMDGYYDVALSLARPMNENLIYMEYFPHHKETAKPWLEGESNVFPDNEKPEDFTDDEGELQSFISRHFLHTSHLSANKMIKDGGKDEIEFRYYPEFEETTCETVLQALIVLQLRSIVHLQYAFKDVLWEKEEWLEEFRDIYSMAILYIEKRMKEDVDIEFRFKDETP